MVELFNIIVRPLLIAAVIYFFLNLNSKINKIAKKLNVDLSEDEGKSRYDELVEEIEQQEKNTNNI